MANKFNRFLSNNSSSAEVTLADYQHASKLYVDDTFRLAPKTKFLYYVVFNVNPKVLSNGSPFKDRHLMELNYLVKSTDLPKYTMESEPLNQYNRKTTAYTKITYDPINLTFHDDNQGVTNGLWALYYGYYFRDRFNSSQPYEDVYPVAYQNNTYVNKARFPFRYGLDNDSSEPFFYSIQLFTLTKQKFFSYLLCNPKITSWQHDQMNQNENNGIVENKLTIAYDAVIYSSGNVEVDSPKGFAVLHYDQTQSPLGNDLIIENGIDGIFDNVFSREVYAGPSTYFSRIRNTLQQYVNLGNRQVSGSQTPSLFSLTNFYPNSVGGLGDIQIPSTGSPSGEQYGPFIPGDSSFQTEGVARPTNLSGGITREDLPPIDSNRTESIQQDWAELDRYGGELPPVFSPSEGDADRNGIQEPITTDAWASAWPQTQSQADENRVAQGTNTTVDQGGNYAPQAQPTVNQTRQTLTADFSLQRFREQDPENAQQYSNFVRQRTNELAQQYIIDTGIQARSPQEASLMLDAVQSQARARAEVEGLTRFASEINISGAGNIQIQNPTTAIPFRPSSSLSEALDRATDPQTITNAFLRNSQQPLIGTQDNY